MIAKEIVIKGSMREQFKDGTSKLANRTCYGYVKQDDGTLAIHKDKAEIVRWIFQRYLAGDSLSKIAEGLELQRIPSPVGKEKWNRQAIDKMLSNEKYMGCVLLQKTFTVEGRQIRNDGGESRYLYQNNNPAIISDDTFAAVQEEKVVRARKHEKAVVRNELMQYILS